MVTIGNNTRPGTIATIESAEGVGANVAAPGDVAIIGAADLTGSDGGSASEDTLYRVTRAADARNKFGDADGSPLTRAVIDALVEGAYPVYAVPGAQNSVSGEDLSGKSGDTGSLANAPVIEQADKIVFTINSTTKTTVLYYDDDPANATPGTDEVLLNPVTGKYRADESQGNAGDAVDYEWFDFTNSHEQVKTAYDSTREVYVRDVVDRVFTLSENDSVVSDLQTTIGEMENNGWLAVGQAGAGDPYIADTSTYTNPFDDSRMQLFYPSRDGDNRTNLGAIAGRLAALGIDASPMFKTMGSLDQLQFTLSGGAKDNLVGVDVVPLEERRQGVRFGEDLTTVSDNNSSESAWERSFARLVTDYVYDFTDEISGDYIGDLHLQSTRNSLKSDIAHELSNLLASNSITGFALNVTEIDSLTAAVDVTINTTEPLRNIQIELTAGDVSSGVGS